jgi:hypothetical protein
VIYERAFMEGTLDTFDFVLAESLHMTVQEMRDRMLNSEYHQWRAFFKYRREMQELEIKKMEAKRGR